MIPQTLSFRAPLTASVGVGFVLAEAFSSPTSLGIFVAGCSALCLVGLLLRLYPDHRRRKRGVPRGVGPRKPVEMWQFAASVVGLIGGIVFARWSSGSGTDTEDPMARLTTGVCFNLSATDLAFVPCAQPHDNEAYYRYTFPPGPYPGDAVSNAPISTCDAHLGGYVGGAHVAEYFDWPVAPDQSEWAAGIHFTVCALARGDGGKITGSAHQTR